MSIISAGEFKRLKYNVQEVSHNADPLHSFPALKRIRSFAQYKRDDKGRVIRYLILMYDKNSPLIKYYTNLSERKTEAARLAGFDLKDELDRFKELASFGDEEFLGMVLEWLRVQEDLKFAQIVSNEETFFEYQMELLSAVSSFRQSKDKLQALQIKGKLLEDSDAIVNRLDRLYREVYGQDNEIHEAVKRVRSNPEAIASSRNVQS